jgi:hypothetical protein
MPLACRADIERLSNWSKPCGSCNICQPTSALKYPFQRDLVNSTMLVEELKKFITTTTGLQCRDTDIHQNPDIMVFDENQNLIARIEAKYLEGKAFMKVAQMISDPLFPKETLVVDEPKLISYFECQHRDSAKYKRHIPIYVVWKYDRPCADVGGICIYQDVRILQTIYNEKRQLRSFTRRTGQGDFVNGRRLGVIDKFHYSITECKPIEKLPGEIQTLPNN